MTFWNWFTMSLFPDKTMLKDVSRIASFRVLRFVNENISSKLMMTALPVGVFIRLNISIRHFPISPNRFHSTTFTSPSLSRTQFPAINTWVLMILFPLSHIIMGNLPDLCLSKSLFAMFLIIFPPVFLSVTSHIVIISHKTL